jgi:hypothetical protein
VASAPQSARFSVSSARDRDRRPESSGTITAGAPLPEANRSRRTSKPADGDLALTELRLGTTAVEALMTVGCPRCCAWPSDEITFHPWGT